MEFESTSDSHRTCLAKNVDDEKAMEADMSVHEYETRPLVIHERPGPELPEPTFDSYFKAVGWMSINTLATVGIVFINKRIFSDQSLRLCQLTFASFHFFITWLTLFILSRRRFNFFVPRRTAAKHVIPLAVVMCLNVVLPNTCLAFSSVMFYQIARILLTPTVALMNFLMYRETLSKGALIALVPACVGVGMVTYFETSQKVEQRETTSLLGVAFAFTGIFASSLYTVWIGSYQRNLGMSSMQLLYNQAPIASALLLFFIPFLDVHPRWSAISVNIWFQILMSGLLASVINLSQFFIVAKTGAVSSTVVGHLKTCTIVVLGWKLSGRPIDDISIIGTIVAITGMFAYSIVMLEQNKH